ncbi:MAG: hypothetical protein EGP67_11415 [Bacteroidales bacterium]|jgi:hypothetical protein|nr:hypothetical protein [Bacteroidales bacterium]
MKKIFYWSTFLFVALCSVGLFSSCGDDNDEPKGDDLVEKLQGTWYFDVMKIKVAGQVLEFTADELKHESGYDGFYDEKLTFSGNRVNGLEYSVKKNSVLLPWYEEQDWWATVSFSGSKMTMYYSVYSEGVKMELWSVYRSGTRCVTDVEGNATTIGAVAVKIRDRQ